MIPLEHIGWARMEELQRQAADPRRREPVQHQPLAEVRQLETSENSADACTCAARTA